MCALLLLNVGEFFCTFFELLSSSLRFARAAGNHAESGNELTLSQFKSIKTHQPFFNLPSPLVSPFNFDYSTFESNDVTNQRFLFTNVQ